MSFSQEVIALPYRNKALTWAYPQREYHSDIWDTRVLTNVSKPTLRVFRAPVEITNGTSVIIAPGGGLHALSLYREGIEVAQWLNTKGITAFVLHYRLVPTGNDGVKELTNIGITKPKEIKKRVHSVLPLAIADGLTAISYVRENAALFNLHKDKIGFMGFSAGGSVAMGVSYKYAENNRPNFLALIYPWATVIPVQKPLIDAPPLFVVCASDDPWGLAVGSMDLYKSWLVAGHESEVHIFSKGGHGFGMTKQALPSDNWILQFYDWTIASGLIP